MRKVLDWKGKKHDIDAMRYSEMKEYIAVAMSLADDITENDRLGLVDRLFELCHCPTDVLAELYAEEANDLIDALRSAHFGDQEGVDEGNGEGGAVAH